MGPKRGAGMTGCGLVRRGRDSRTPRSSRGGRRGASSAPSSSSLEEGFWCYNFLLRVRGRSAARILLPPAFATIVSERRLDGLLLRLQGCVRSPSYVELEIDSSRLIFLGFGWSSFSWWLNLRDSDTLFSALMAKILSPSALLTRAAIAWNRTGRRQAATIPAGRGVLRLRLQRLHPLATLGW